MVRLRYFRDAATGHFGALTRCSLRIVHRFEVVPQARPALIGRGHGASASQRQIALDRGAKQPGVGGSIRG